MAGEALRELLAQFVIGVDDRQLQRGHEQVEGFLGTLKEFGKLVAGAFALHEVKAFVEEQVHAATSLEHTARMVGITTTELQAMQLAAGESAVSTEAMGPALRFLNKNLADAKLGIGDASVNFRRLGIAITDSSGAARPAGVVIGDLADKIAGMKDPAERTRVAMALLGRGGAELVPLLSKGSAAFADARKELEELGGGFSENFIAKAAEAERQQVRLDVALSSLKSIIADAILPAFRGFVEGMTKVIVAIKNYMQVHPAFAAAVKAIAIAVGVAAVAAAVSLTIALAEMAYEAVETAAPFIALGLIIAALTGQLGEVRDAIDGVFSDVRATTDHAADDFAAFTARTGGTKAGLEALADTSKKATDALDDGAGGARRMGAEAQKTTGAVNRLRGALDGAKEAAKSFFGRGGEGQPPHRPVPKLTRLPNGQMGYLTPEAPNFGGLLPPNTVDFTGGKGSAPPRIVPELPAHAGKSPVYVPQAARAPSLQSQLAAAGITINQKVDTKVEVHTSSDQPKAIGEAVGQGVATATQRANDRARTAFARP